MKPKLLKCAIDRTWYGGFRSHCPTCGCFTLGGATFDYAATSSRLLPLVSGLNRASLSGVSRLLLAAQTLAEQD